jgi:hypothetical protein
MFCPKKRPEKQKTHVGLNSGNVGFGTLLTLYLSPETPLARAVRLATRSVARARTTHRLATDIHRVLRIRAAARKSQIRANAKNKSIASKNR